MPRFPVLKARRSKRVVAKRRASLVINLDSKPKRYPCLVLDSSKEGFRLRGSFALRRGQVVELILDEETPSPERCSVVWIGKAGSEQALSRKEKSAWNRANLPSPVTRAGKPGVRPATAKAAYYKRIHQHLPGEFSFRWKSELPDNHDYDRLVIKR